MGKDPPKILIVEDEPEMREMCSRAVESWGYIAIQSSDGMRGWYLLEDNPDISLVILDVCLPCLDGRDFILRARQHPVFRTLPIIIVSGFVRIHDIEEYLKLGASRFLPKPYRISELHKYVKLLIYGANCEIKTDSPGP